jgi:hypothetical protein
VASFPNCDLYIPPAELETTQGDTECLRCLVHPEQNLDLFCDDCQMIVCQKCVLTKHSQPTHHATNDLHETVLEARVQLKKDEKRLKQAVDYMSAQVEAATQEERALGDSRADLEAQIHTKCDMMTALVEELRASSLSSLQDTCTIITREVTQQMGDKQSNLDQLRQLQQQVQQAVTSNKASQLLNVAKEMREGRGSAKAVDGLKTVPKEYFTQPTLSFTMAEDIIREAVKKALTPTVKTVMMRAKVPEVIITISEQFRCGPEKDIRVFSVCPHDNRVSVSYELRGGKGDALVDVFDRSGKFLKQRQYAGKSTAQAQEDGTSKIAAYNKGGDCKKVYSKSQRKTAIELSHKASEDKGNVVEGGETNLCTIFMPCAQRAFDVNADLNYVAVLQETTRRVMLYKTDQPFHLDVYSPPSPGGKVYTPFPRPSDVCFFTLEERWLDEEVLLVADEGTDSIHVLSFKDETLTFLRYLAPGCPLLVQPTALNTDHTGQLWVTCKGGVILTMKCMTN